MSGKELPPDHPARAYVDDGRALLQLIRDDPTILSSSDLKFLRDFVSDFVAGTLADDRGAAEESQDGAEDKGSEDRSQEDEDAGGAGSDSEEIDEDDYREDDISPHEYGSNRKQALNVDDYDTYETIVIGAGPAGLGVAAALLRGGHRRSSLLVIEQNAVGSTFDDWHADTRFISPSWNCGNWGPVDLNCVDPLDGGNTVGVAAFCAADGTGGAGSGIHGDTSTEQTVKTELQVAGLEINLGSQHPSGPQYARYLRYVATRHRIPIREHTRVISVNRVPGSDACPAGGYEIEIESIADGENGVMTKQILYSKYIVWCGGEWGYPNAPAGEDYQDGAFVHYAQLGRTEKEWCGLAERARSNPVLVLGGDNNGDDDAKKKKKKSHAVVIGAYEAGVDTACALLKRGVEHVTLVDSEDYVAGWTGVETTNRLGIDATIATDPSEALSPISSSRLQHAIRSGRLSLMPSRKCVGAACRDGIFEGRTIAASTATATGTDLSLAASIPIIFCTGFSPSKNGVMDSLVKWNDRGSPLVSRDCDESTLSPGFFICGPMLRHWVRQESSDTSSGGMGCSSNGDNGGCGSYHPPEDATEEKKSSKVVTRSRSDDESTSQKEVEIIFCFIYKFRTRFALVAGEILSRLVCESHTETTPDDGILIDRVGNERLSRLEKMLALYRERGMFTNTLDCSLSCHATPGHYM